MSGGGEGETGTAAGGRLRERPDRGGALPLYRNAAWEERWTGLRAGITGGGPRGPDYGLSTAPSASALAERIGTLARELGFSRTALPRQVHGADVVPLHGPGAEGVLLCGPADGLVTGASGVLLLVTAADCVPVYLAGPGADPLGLLHAGWRGVAAGILEAGIGTLAERFGTEPRSLRVHLGPAICGECYRVGPEVAEALGRPAGEGRVDLRALLAARASDAGVEPGRITVSGWCTLCDGDQFHSHRGRGRQAGRMAAYLGRTRAV